MKYELRQGRPKEELGSQIQKAASEEIWKRPRCRAAWVGGGWGGGREGTVRGRSLSHRLLG